MKIHPLLIVLATLCAAPNIQAQNTAKESSEVAVRPVEQAAPGVAATAPTEPAAPVTTVSHSGTVKRVNGEVTLVTPQGSRALQPGDRVSAKDKLVTAEKSSASLVLRDGTALSIGERAQMDIRSFRYNSTTQEGGIVLGLLEGTMRVITGAIAKLQGNDVQVITKTSTIGARGTDFVVEVRE